MSTETEEKTPNVDDLDLNIGLFPKKKKVQKYKCIVLEGKAEKFGTDGQIKDGDELKLPATTLMQNIGKGNVIPNESNEINDKFNKAAKRWLMTLKPKKYNSNVKGWKNGKKGEPRRTGL